MRGRGRVAGGAGATSAVKILHVIPSLAARDGGPPRVALGTCRRLRAAGHEATIATTDADGHGRHAVPRDLAPLREGVPTRYFPRRSGAAIKWSPELARWLAGHAGDYDILDVHAVFSHASMAAGRAARRAAIPYVVRPHGSLDPWSLGRRRWAKRALLASTAGRLLRGAAAIQYTTPEEQELAEAALPWLPAGVVVPLALDDDAFDGAGGPERTRERVVLVMSRLDPKKGIEPLIRAFHSIKASGSAPGWRLVIAGDGRADYVAALKAQASAGEGADAIEFAGWVEGEARLERLSRSAFLAAPSAQENFGLSVAEAMARSTPVLVTAGVNLAREIAAGGAGWVVDSVAGVEQVLRAAIADPEERARRGRAARTLAGRFTWPRAIDALVGCYTDAVRTRPTGRVGGRD
jgi:glycosyltransferase involved in cell wall biosynthesis